MTTQDQYIESVLGNLPLATPQRSQIALELRGHIAEGLSLGQPLDEILRRLGDPRTLAESYLKAVPLTPARLGNRVRAKLVDIAAVLVAVVLLAAVPAVLAGSQLLPPELLLGFVPLIVLVGGSFVFAAYTIAAEHVYGHTLGKHLFGLRVVRESGARISLGQSLVRQLPMFLQIFLIDALFSLFTERKQRAFELLSKTRTVQLARGAGR